MLRSQNAIGLGGMITLLAGLVAWDAAPAAAQTAAPGGPVYLLTQPAAPQRESGALLQIGTGLPLPVGPQGIFTGGQMSATGSVPSRKGMTSVMVLTGPAIWPQLLIGPVPAALSGDEPISQDLATPKGGSIKIPKEILSASHLDGIPKHGGVFNTNPSVYDVATTISYQWPSATATFSPTGGPGNGFSQSPSGTGGTISYLNAPGKMFGGPALFALAEGPNAGTRVIPPNGAGMLPIATVFINGAMGTPQMVGAAAIVGASNPFGYAAQGATHTALSMATAFGPVPNAFHQINSPPFSPIMGTFPCTKWCAGPNGTLPLIPKAAPNSSQLTWSIGPGTGPFTHNNALTKGFPWTTGQITISNAGALGAETFFLVGKDDRASSGTAPGMTGVGNISLVSGSLSTRKVSAGNANRAWVSLNLPEPGAALGAAGALGVLALCHGLVRRRSR